MYALNLRTELFRPLWTHQRSTEEMRPNLIAMKNKISKAMSLRSYNIHTCITSRVQMERLEE